MLNQQEERMALLLLNEDELRQAVTVTESIEAIKSSFANLAEGRINAPGAFSLNLPEVKGNVQTKGVYTTDAPYYVIKISSAFLNNPTLNLPLQNELLLLFDAATGYPAAIMMDNSYLTTMRAGAAGALTAAYLANEQIEQVAVIGSGNLAYSLIKSLMVVRTFNSVYVWGRTPVHADSYARLIVEDHDLDVEIAPSIEAAVRQADLIITATASQQPLIQVDWLKPGVHLIATGSNSPAKQELHPDVLKRADIIIVDNLDQCATSGELHHALEAGVMTKEDVQGELGDLIIGKIKGRTHSDQITVADLTGLDMQESAIAIVALEKALFLGLGLRAESTASVARGSPDD